MSIFNLKHINTFMPLFTHPLYISQWKICLLRIASLNNISKNGSSPLICILSSNLEFCIPQVVPIMLHLLHLQAARKGVLWRICIHFPNIVCNFACFKVLTIYLLQTQICWHYIYHTAQPQLFFCISTLLFYFIKRSFYRKVPNKPSKVQRSMLYIRCAQIF